MNNILDIIALETKGKSFKSHKYCYESSNNLQIEYDNDNKVVWKDHGETLRHKEPINLTIRANKYKNIPSIFSYFLDGSRHTYKVDDMSYNKNVYPILAGQAAIGCCRRTNKKLKKELYKKNNIIVLPDISYDEWDDDIFLKELLDKVNENYLLKKMKVKFDCVKKYKRDGEDVNLEKKGIAVIQDYMINMEKEAVAVLAEEHKLNENNYLIKDGSLEYKAVKKGNGKDLRDKHIANNFNYVIGVSKSFNPTKCEIKFGGSNSDVIANLKLFERTPAYMYKSDISGKIYFAIWYIRIRKRKYTTSAFDGVIKVEKILNRQSEIENGLDSELIDHISSHLINERNPLCYGKDLRWANHLYPIYLTESFIKSKYMSSDLFMNLF